MHKFVDFFQQHKHNILQIHNDVCGIDNIPPNIPWYVENIKKYYVE